MKKYISKNLYKIFKVILLLIFLFLVITNPFILIFVFESFMYISMSIFERGFVYTISVLFSILIIYHILRTVVGPWLRRQQLMSTSIQKNTFAKGKKRWITDKEMRDNFVEADYNNNFTYGFLVTRYAKLKIKIFGRWIDIKKVPFIDGSASKDAENLYQKLSAEGFSESEKSKKLKKLKKKSKYEKAVFIFSKIKILKTMWVDTILLNIDPLHCIIIGTTRSGKSQSLVLVMVDMWSKIKKASAKPSFCCMDPKAEILNNTYKKLKRAGYKVVVVNLDQHDNSHSFNPLELVKIKLLESMLEFGNNIKIGNHQVDGIAITFNNVMVSIFKNLKKNNDSVEKYVNENIYYLKKELSTCTCQYEARIIGNGKKTEQVKVRDENCIRCLVEDEFQKCMGRMGEVTELIKLVSSGIIIIPPDTKSEFFPKTARRILNSVIFYVLEESFIDLNFDKFNLHNVTLYIVSTVSNGMYEKKLLSTKSPDNTAKLELGGEKINADVMSTLLTDIGIYTDPSIGRLTARNQIEFDQISNGDVPWAIFLITPEYKKIFNSLCTIFVDQMHARLSENAKRNGDKINITETLSSFKSNNSIKQNKDDYIFEVKEITPQKYTGTNISHALHIGKSTGECSIVDSRIQKKIFEGDINQCIYYLDINRLHLSYQDLELFNCFEPKLKRKFVFLLEEMGNVPALSELPSKLTVCLGAGIQYVMIIQDYAQLDQVYGEKVKETILSNTQMKLYLLSADSDTREKFSKQVGDTTELKADFSGKELDEKSISESEIEKPLISPVELDEMKMFTGILSITKLPAIKSTYRPAFQYMQDEVTSTQKIFKSRAEISGSDNLDRNEMTDIAKISQILAGQK